MSFGCRDVVRSASTTGTNNNLSFVIVFGIPFCHIVFDIMCNAIHCIGGADDAVVETRLPRKRDGVLVGVTGDGLFELPNNNG